MSAQNDASAMPPKENDITLQGGDVVSPQGGAAVSAQDNDALTPSDARLHGDGSMVPADNATVSLDDNGPFPLTEVDALRAELEECKDKILMHQRGELNAQRECVRTENALDAINDTLSDTEYKLAASEYTLLTQNQKVANMNRELWHREDELSQANQKLRVKEQELADVKSDYAKAGQMILLLKANLAMSDEMVKAKDEWIETLEQDLALADRQRRQNTQLLALLSAYQAAATFQGSDDE